MVKSIKNETKISVIKLEYQFFKLYTRQIKIIKKIIRVRSSKKTAGTTINTYKRMICFLLLPCSALVDNMQHRPLQCQGHQGLSRVHNLRSSLMRLLLPGRVLCV